MRKIIVILVLLAMNLFCVSAYCQTEQERIDRLSPENRLKYEVMQKEQGTVNVGNPVKTTFWLKVKEWLDRIF